MTAALRSDYAASTGDQAFIDLVAELQRLDSQFKRWWARHDVFGCASGVRRYQHPLIGTIELEYSAFTVESCPEWKLVTHTPTCELGKTALERLMV